MTSGSQKADYTTWCPYLWRSFHFKPMYNGYLNISVVSRYVHVIITHYVPLLIFEMHIIMKSNHEFMSFIDVWLQKNASNFYYKLANLLTLTIMLWNGKKWHQFRYIWWNFNFVSFHSRFIFFTKNLKLDGTVFQISPSFPPKNCCQMADDAEMAHRLYHRIKGLFKLEI